MVDDAQAQKFSIFKKSVKSESNKNIWYLDIYGLYKVSMYLIFLTKFHNFFIDIATDFFTRTVPRALEIEFG